MRQVFQKEFNYYGKRMRPYFRVRGLAVSEDGKTVLRQYDKDFGSSIISARSSARLTVQTDENGIAYVNTKDHGKLMVAGMVAVCFCPPCPHPCNEYELVHKDGNLSNCHYLNLEWKSKSTVPKVTLHTTDKSIKLSNGLIVHNDGIIYDKKQKLKQEISQYDSDTNLFWSIGPRVTYYRKNRWGREERQRATLDELMAAAGYVAGERYQFQNPVILHIDKNWLNVNTSNLEWCDASDQRYVDYRKKRIEDMNTWNKANNKDFPDCYL